MPRTVRIPKKIAGVKLPKQVRKKAKKAIKASTGPVVREIGERIARRFEGRARIEIDGERIAEAFRTAALDGLRSFLAGLEEGLAKAEARSKGDDPQPEPQAKRRAAKKKLKKPKAAKPAPRAPAA
ncbi:MAG TPA: hypothetical protein VGW40_14435 [Allosphingosinicella sp.]|nr:hypothetical protein [Allosphingosinicella sp.]